MKIIGIFVGVVLMGLGILWVASPSAECQGESCDNASQQQSLPQQAVTAAEQGQGYLFDVRTPEEFNDAHAKQAVNFDVELIKAGQLPDVPKDSNIYVYCRSGNRSAQATQLLNAAGFSNVTDLGGLDAMKQAGVL
jgi:phage shock protein E